MKLPAFPKILTLNSTILPEIMDGEIEITEKIDGSFFAFGYIDGEIFFRSKNKDITHDTHDKMFREGIEYVKSIENRLKKYAGWVFYCEYLRKEKHNVIKYSRIPHNHLYLFGALFEESYAKGQILTQIAEYLDIEPPNILYEGDAKETPPLEILMDKKSILGNEKMEGIVIKNYNKKIKFAEKTYPIAVAKVVRDDFKERHTKEWKRKKGLNDRINSFLESFRTEARWRKAVQHLKDNGDLEFQPRDIGKLVKEIQKDILEEEKENIKNELFEIYKKAILRKAVAGFPEWYKKELIGGEL